MRELGKLREGSGFTAQLLRAGARDAPSARARHAAEAALGLSLTAAGVSAGSSTAHAALALRGATSTHAKHGLIVLAKWFGCGLLAGSAVATGPVAIEAWSRRNGAERNHRVTPAAVSNQAAGLAPRSVERLEAASSAAGPDATPPLATSAGQLPNARPASPPELVNRGEPMLASPHAGAPSPSVGITDSALAQEIVLLERVRAKVRSGDGRGALTELDAIAPRIRTLSMEAELLRVEALLENGERARAEALAAELRRRHPGEPQSFRLKRLFRSP